MQCVFSEIRLMQYKTSVVFKKKKNIVLIRKTFLCVRINSIYLSIFYEEKTSHINYVIKQYYII